MIVTLDYFELIFLGQERVEVLCYVWICLQDTVSDSLLHRGLELLNTADILFLFKLFKHLQLFCLFCKLQESYFLNFALDSFAQ